MTYELQAQPATRNGLPEQARIEAALYSSGRPLLPEELARAAGLTSKRKATRIAREVAKLFKENLRAVEVVELKDGRFTMQLKKEFYSLAKKFASRPLLSKSALRTLSYIAFFQPVSSLQLAKKLGTRTYQNIRELERLGFVAGSPSDRTKIYRTTQAFAGYFGLSGDAEELKLNLSRYLAGT